MLVPHLRGTAASAEVLFPGEMQVQARWEPVSGALTVTLPQVPAACLVRLRTSQIA